MTLANSDGGDGDIMKEVLVGIIQSRIGRHKEKTIQKPTCAFDKHISVGLGKINHVKLFPTRLYHQHK